MRYSIFSILAQALQGQKGWKPVWREPTPKASYDAIVVGGGGHGLATAYYLAKNHGLANIAVVEKSYLGSGNVGRNTTIIRSNYLLPGNTPFYEHSLKLWEGLEQDINYNAMVSQRGCLNLYHSDSQRDAYARRGNAMRLLGIDAELLDREGVRKLYPMLDFDNARFPIHGGLLQPRGGSVRHDAVAWGYARAADLRGVDLIQNCEVTGIRVENGRVLGVETQKGFIGAKKVGLACAGNSSRVAAMAGLKLPIESHVLQAFVSEGVKPLVPGVVTFGAGHFYISQSNKGGLVFGGGIDGYNSYAQRGNLPIVEDVAEEAMAMMPMVGRLRVLRSWGGVMDMSMDGSPIIDKTPIEGLYLNAGWCYGGFKATPASGWCFAHTIARDEPHALNAAFRLDRFRTGRLIDERAPAPSQICTRKRISDAHYMPHCGARDAQEFTYLGDASVQRPVTPVEQPIDDQVLDVWHDYVYLRENPAGELRELWYHGGGCHQWLVVTRNVRTHEISGPAVPAASARARS